MPPSDMVVAHGGVQGAPVLNAVERHGVGGRGTVGLERGEAASSGEEQSLAATKLNSAGVDCTPALDLIASDSWAATALHALQAGRVRVLAAFPASPCSILIA